MTSVLADRSAVNQGRFVHSSVSSCACELAINVDHGGDSRVVDDLRSNAVVGSDETCK